jgi:lipopolysaccharide biosynthesis glycosyltransferase
MHVVFASDEEGFPGLQRGMLSLVRNIKDTSALVIHVLVPSEAFSAAEKMLECFNADSDLQTNSFGEKPKVVLQSLLLSSLDNSSRFARQHHSSGIARLFMDRYLPADVQRVLWLDIDTIVASDIRPLFTMPMSHPMAAVKEFAPRTFRVAYMRNVEASAGRPNVTALMDHVREPNALIFNSGVLLVDLPKWRAQGCSGSLENLAVQLPHAGQQLLLNLLFQDDDSYTQLDWHWNVLGLGGVFPPRHEQAKQGYILHWSGMEKPWLRQAQAIDAKANTQNLVNPLLFKSGVHMPDMSHAQFDYLVAPYQPYCNSPRIWQQM